jgi:transcriptional regulator of arginine metabolism
MADGVLYTCCGPERSVASTKTFTAASAVLYLFATWLGQARGTVDEDRLRRLLADLPLEIDEAPPLLVLRTSPGAANAIARALDLLDVDGIVGTLAGDDTIFVACRDAAAIAHLRTRFVALAAGEAVVDD